MQHSIITTCYTTPRRSPELAATQKAALQPAEWSAASVPPVIKLTINIVHQIVEQQHTPQSIIQLFHYDSFIQCTT